MAEVHRMPLSRPFWKLEVLELDATETEADGTRVRVKRLYLVDPHSSRGLIFLKSQPCHPPSGAGVLTSVPHCNLDQEAEVIE